MRRTTVRPKVVTNTTYIVDSSGVVTPVPSDRNSPNPASVGARLKAVMALKESK